MAAINPTTRAQIKVYLEEFIDRLIEQHKRQDITDPNLASNSGSFRLRGGNLKPFHAAMIPKELLRMSAFERSFSSSLGSTYEECARIIALDHHADAKRSYDVQGSVSQAAINELERQVEIFEHAAEVGTSRPSLEKMIHAVLDARQTDDLRALGIRADLYVQTHNGESLFFEMKSPVPNKGQCIEVTQRILRFHLLRGEFRPKTQAYFAMAYNPYGLQRDQYKWSMARNYTPFDQAVLIGHEFWDIIGGTTAYEELLEIYAEAGKEKSKYMIDALAFGF